MTHHDASDLPDKSAYDELPDGVVVTDSIGTVLILNPAASRLLQREPDDAVGRPLADVLPLEDPAGHDWWACTQPFDGLDSRTRQPERRLTLTSGPCRGTDLLVTTAYVRDESRRLLRLVVSLRDTNARDRHERSRADLVSTVAHELRSPLTSVKGFTATLLAKWDRFSDEQKQLMLTTVNADADRVTRLLSELLDVSRIDAGRLEMHRQVVDVESAAQRVVASRVASGDPPETFSIVVTGDLPEMWLDPDKMAQIFGNLIENALRHGGGRVTVTISPDGPAGAPTGAVVTVEDEGEGIPEDMLPRVFAKFWRGGARRGTGLGLYIVKGLVEAHGGSIEAGRSGSGGARFRFTLPASTPSFL